MFDKRLHIIIIIIMITIIIIIIVIIIVIQMIILVIISSNNNDNDCLELLTTSTSMSLIGICKGPLFRGPLIVSLYNYMFRLMYISVLLNKAEIKLNKDIRPISQLRLWISEGLTQSES